VVVGFVAGGSRQPWHEGVSKGLRESGYVEGENLRIEYRYANGNQAELSGLVAELLQENPQVIVAADTASIQEAVTQTSTVPIVMAISGDPVKSGFVDSLARPGRNVTGLTNTAPDVATKKLELLRDAVPGLARVGVMANPRNAVTELVVSQMQAAAAILGLDIYVLSPSSAEEMDAAFQTASETGVQAVVVVGDPLYAQQQGRIEALLSEYRLPALVDAGLTERGGLVGYGPDFRDLFRRSGVYAAEILRGARPADLPVEQPSQYELVVNLKTADALGLAMPRSLLLQADRIVQ
jgi:putative tryptophan/tyrosine transport system substrate-binding protein